MLMTLFCYPAVHLVFSTFCIPRSYFMRKAVIYAYGQDFSSPTIFAVSILALLLYVKQTLQIVDQYTYLDVVS